MNHLLQIKNDGTLIVQTNFWETEFNERGLYYLLNANPFIHSQPAFCCKPLKLVNYK